MIFVQQYTINRGLKKIGVRAEEATTKELKQIHEMGTYQPMDATKLTQKGKMEALYSLVFITEKRDGRFKSCRYVIGSKQRKFYGYDKATGSTPTV